MLHRRSEAAPLPPWSGGRVETLGRALIVCIPLAAVFYLLMGGGSISQVIPFAAAWLLITALFWYERLDLWRTRER